MPLLRPRNDYEEHWVVAPVGAGLDHLHDLRSTGLGNLEVIRCTDVMVRDLTWVDQNLDLVALVQATGLLDVQLGDHDLYVGSRLSLGDCSGCSVVARRSSLDENGVLAPLLDEGAGYWAEYVVYAADCSASNAFLSLRRAL